MDKPLVVSGEASETDSDDEMGRNSIHQMTKHVQGAVITGEDSESDTDMENNVARATSVLNQKELATNSIIFDSLFHQKLRENNIQLNCSLENICQSTVNDATKQLNVIDQHILRSQVTMQHAVTALKSLSINSLTIKSKVHSLLSSNFLSNVTLEKT